MPLIKLQTSVPLTGEQEGDLLKASSEILADITGKPETYVLAVAEKGAMCMAGEVGPAAFVDVRGIGGLTREVNAAVSSGICDLLKKSLGIEPARVYLTFTDVAAQNWGWDGKTFG